MFLTFIGLVLRVYNVRTKSSNDYRMTQLTNLVDLDNSIQLLKQYLDPAFQKTYLFFLFVFSWNIFYE